MKRILVNFLNLLQPFFAGMIAIGVSLFILQPFMATKFQKYEDIILEMVALLGGNKSGELVSVWTSLLVGIFVMIIIYKLKEKKIKKLQFLYKEKEKVYLGESVLIIPIIFILLFKQEVSFYLLIIVFVYFISYIWSNKDRNLSIKILLLLFSTYYFSLVIKIILDIIIIEYEIIKVDTINILTLIIFSLILFFQRKNIRKKIDKLILFFQFPIPLVLLADLRNQYLFKDGIKVINLPFSYSLIIIMIILTLLLLNYYIYKKNKKIVLYSSIITLFILHSYISPSLIYSGDPWHLGDELLAWHQIIDKKLIMYQDYNGNSGWYALVSGFFQNFVLPGKDLYFPLAHSLTSTFWAIIIGSLFYIIAGAELSLIISLFVSIPIYNRPLMMFSSFLILLIPKLICSRIKWLQMYILLSILSIFYYPLNGVALFLGCGIFALIQIYIIFEKREWKKSIKDIQFWILNVILLVVISKLYKYIIPLIKNILLLSSQSKLADSIVVYGFSIPSAWFMKYISNKELINKLWYTYLFTVILSVILWFIYILYFYLKIDRKENFKQKIQKSEFFLLSSSIIIIVVNYTFTILRIEPSFEYSRTTPTMVLFMGFVMTLFIYKYGINLFGKNIRNILLGILIGFVYLIKGNSIGEEKIWLQKFYKVPKKYTYINGKDIKISKLGEGFMPITLLESIKTIKNNVEKTVYNDEKFWINVRKEFVYIFDSKLPVKFETMKFTKSLKASKQNLDMLKKNPPILIMDIFDYESYYVYRWIVDNYLMYSDKGEFFWIRKDRYQKVYGNLEDGKKKMLDIYPSQNIKKIPYSIGNSFSTLQKRFDFQEIVEFNNLKKAYNQMEELTKNRLRISQTKDPFIIMDIPKKVSNEKMDFLLIKLTSNRKLKDLKDKNIQIYWEAVDTPFSENRSVKFNYGNGNLLIPLGVHPAWLLTDKTRMIINFREFEKDTEFSIQEMRFLKLNLTEEK